MKNQVLEDHWTVKQRGLWWLKYVAGVFAISTAALGLGKWIYSRASIDDVVALEKIKIDKDQHEKDIGKIEKRIEKQDKFLNVIHTNVIRLMEHSDVQPQRLPTNLEPQD